MKLVFVFLCVLLANVASGSTESDDGQEWVAVTHVPLVNRPGVAVVKHHAIGRYHLYVLRGHETTVQEHLFDGESNGGRVPVTFSRDAPIKAHGCRTSPGVAGRGFLPGHFSYAIDMADQRTGTPDSSFCTGPSTGEGTHVFVPDTGISNHATFALPVSQDFDYFTGVAPVGDCVGHGTHVAGLIASTVYGVAPGARLHSVRILDCNGDGTFGSLVAGLLYVAEAHVNGPKIVNLSLGALHGASTAVEYLLAQLAGPLHQVTVVVSAGNDATDACLSFPGRLSTVVTVGATTEFLAKASFSNQGPCADLWAGGRAVVSANGEGHGSEVKSGTSMAAPIVTGRVAILKSEHPGWTVGQVRAELINDATNNRVTGLSGDSHNRLVHVRPQGTLSASPPAFPTSPPPTSDARRPTLGTALTSLLAILALPLCCWFFSF